MSKNKLSTEERIKAVESYIQGITGLNEVPRIYSRQVNCSCGWHFASDGEVL